MRYVIIGASAAGCKAAETLRRYAPNHPITVISEEAQPLYSRPLLTYVLSGEVSREKVWLKGEDYFREWNFEPLLGEPVVRVDPAAHAVHLLGGRAIPYDRLLIASGARPRLLGLKGEELSGVYTLRTLADWQRLAAGLPQAGRVVVVGAGAVGLKTADALARRGLTVTLVARGAQPLSRVLDATAAALLQAALTRMGIEIIHHAWPEAIWGEAGRVRALTLNDGRELPCQAVLFSIGVAPNVEFLAGTDLAGPEGIPVDQQLGTADPAHLCRRRLRPRLPPLDRETGRLPYLAGGGGPGPGGRGQPGRGGPLLRRAPAPEQPVPARFSYHHRGPGSSRRRGLRDGEPTGRTAGATTAASSTGTANWWASPWWARWRTRGFIFS